MRRERKQRIARGPRSVSAPKKVDPNALHRLIVFDVPIHLGGLMVRLKFRPTKNNKAYWWRIFDPMVDSRDSAKSVLSQLSDAGLSQRKWAQIQRYTPPSDRVKADVIGSETTKQIRLARDALKLATERRRQAEKAALRELEHRAASAVRRATGDA